LDGRSFRALSAPCTNGTGYQFTHRVHPGNAKLVLRNYRNPNFPMSDELPRDITVSPTTTTLTVDTQSIAVSGTVTVDGAPLTNCSTTNSFLYATDPVRNVLYEFQFVCGATTTFSGRLPAGDYELYVSLASNEWPLGMWWHTRLTAAPSVALALRTRTVTFNALANGVTPQSTCTGTGTKVLYDLEADSSVGGSVGSVAIACNASGFSKVARVFEGVSTVRVLATASTMAPLVSTLDSRSTTTFTADGPARRLAGGLTVNGQPAGCMSGDWAQLVAVAPGKPFTYGTMTCLNGNWLFDLYAAPGTYRLKAVGGGGGLPETEGLVLDQLVVP
jgi:hypothetical protein